MEILILPIVPTRTENYAGGRVKHEQQDTNLQRR